MRLDLFARFGAVAPFLVILIPNATVVSVPLALVGLAFVAVTIAMALFDLRGAERTVDPKAPTALAALGQLLALTFALTIMSASVAEGSGWFALVLLFPTIMAAVVGSPGFASTVYAACVAGVAASQLWVHPPSTALFASVAAFAIVAGVITVMLSVIGRGLVEIRTNMLNLVTAASTAARAPSVEAGVAHMAELLLSTSLGGQRPSAVEVYRCTPGRSERLGRATLTWQASDETPDHELVQQALRDEGCATAPDRATIAVDEADGTLLVIELAIATPSGTMLNSMVFDLARYALHLEVLVRRLNAYDELDRLGQTDSLTGLPNRRALMKRLEQERPTTSVDSKLSVVMADLDDFKMYNDTFGHPEGDRLLVDFASMLQRRMRSADLVSRYGGEEFCLLLPSTDAKGAKRLLEELHTWAALLRPGQPLTFSAGLTVWDGNEPTASLISRADRALYQAKAAGKDRTVLADETPPDAPPDPEELDARTG